MTETSLSVWSDVQRTLQERTRPSQYDSWLKDLEFVSLDDEGVATLRARNAATRNWVSKYYSSTIRHAFSQIDVPVETVVILLPDEHPPPGPATAVPTPAAAEAEPVAAPVEVYDPQTRARFVLNRAYTFENFVVGPCNRLPHAASLAVAENPGKAYNPLFLHGSVGLGKTHLMQAVCHSLLRRQTKAHVLFLSCEEFVNQFIEAVEQGALDEFRTRYRHVDVLAIDDIHFLANKERTQEEFFHTFNTLYNRNRQIIMSSDSSPAEIPTLEERLVSRFKWGLVTMIESPAFETRVAILMKKARIQGIDLPDAVVQFMAEKLDGSIREIEGAIIKIAGYARLTGQPITLPLVKESLRDVLAEGRRAISIQNIIDVVCEHFGVKVPDLQSKNRKQAITLPRQICMHLARQLTRHSLEEIGGYFGGRDHTTVLHADEKIRRLVAEETEMRAIVDRLTARLKQG